MRRHSQLSLVVLVAGVAALAGLAGQPPDNPPVKNDKAGENRLVVAVKPKPLTPAAEKGVAFLVNQQHANGGWGQAGGWRNNVQNGGRVEGAEIADPPDV